MALSLKAARVNAGLTQKEMAKKMGVSPVTIWKWEKGEVEPRASQFKKLCDVCGVTTEDIFLPNA